MKKVLLVAIMACALPGAAVAQSWNGFYVSGSGGYGWGKSDQTGLIPPPPAPPPSEEESDDAKLRLRGGLIGGGLGWNTQYGNWVFGIDGDYSYAALTAHSDACGSLPNSCGSRLKSFGTVRGKVGAVYGSWLLYASGGWAFGEVSGVSSAKLSGSDIYSGWTVGAGIETLIAPQWSMKLEYLYADLGDRDLYQANVPGFPENVAVRANILRVGINYRFQPYVAPAVPMIAKGPPLK